ncbi:MAG: hypothetical protein ACREVN_03010 [Gammaproteobacteria bacterium]
MIAYYGPLDWAPRAAHGELIEPPVPLPPEAFATLFRNGMPTERLRNRWSFIYARIAPCSDECLAHLIRLYQVRLALPEDRRHRVQMVLLFGGPRPSLPADAGWTTARLDDAAGNTIVELLGEQNIRDGRVYIADPLGNLVMSYPPDAAQKGMLEDLKRLLKLSPASCAADADCSRSVTPEASIVHRSSERNGLTFEFCRADCRQDSMCPLS